MIFSSSIQVRFADIDKLGHVNNAKYLSYCEQARMDYFDQLFGKGSIDWSKQGFILARAETDFIIPVLLDDEVTVDTSCIRIGTKSFDLEYVIKIRRNGQEMEAVRSISVLVAYDYQNQKSVPIPTLWREKLGEVVLGG